MGYCNQLCFIHDIHFNPDGTEQSRLVLPFSLKSRLNTCPDGNRKHVDIGTSPLVFKLDSCSIRDIQHLRRFHCSAMEFHVFPQSHLLDDSPEHDQISVASLALFEATLNKLGKHSSPEVILRSFANRSLSWMYKYPRTVTTVSLKVREHIYLS